MQVESNASLTDRAQGRINVTQFDTRILTDTNTAGQADPITFEFDADSTVVKEYRIDFGDGDRVTGPTPTDNRVSYDHVYDTAGEYTVEVVIETGYGFTSSATASVNVYGLSTGPVVTGGMVTHWPMDTGSGTTIADTAGDTPGSLDGGTWTDNRPVGSSAVDFEPGDYASNGDTGGQHVNESVTLATWAYVEGAGTSDTNRFVSYDDYNRGSGDDGVSLFWDPGSDVHGSSYAGSGTRAVAEATGDVPQDEWVHLVGTYDGSTLQYYVDGSRVASTTADIEFDDDDSVLVVGDRSDISRARIDATLDDVRVYNRSLSGDEVGTLYDETGTPVANPGENRTVYYNAPTELDGSGSTAPGGTITSYEWSLPDGTSETGETVVERLTELGDQRVTLTVTDSDDDGDAGLLALDVERYFDTFDDGTEDWTDADADGRLYRTDGSAYNGSHSLRFRGNDYDDRLGHGATLGSGARPERVAFYFRHSGGDGGGIRFKNSDGDYEAGFAGDANSWVLTGGGNERSIGHSLGNGYWVHVEYVFDWEDGTYRYIITDTDTDRIHTGPRSLASGTDIVQLQAWGHDYSWGMGRYDDAIFDV
ncbi:hypothetical protein BRD17_02035, partial [Halobacteriales archaeon SW_7_68_16]